VDSPNLIVNFRWAINRDNYIINRLRDRGSLRFQQQAGSKQGESNALCAKQTAKGRKICVHLGLAAGEDYPTNPKLSERFDMRLKVLDRYLPVLPNPPDVTHYATAIAAIVGEHNQDRQRPDTVIESWRGSYDGTRNCFLVAHY
jgi:hypothetical protein